MAFGSNSARLRAACSNQRANCSIGSAASSVSASPSARYCLRMAAGSSGGVSDGHVDRSRGSSCRSRDLAEGCAGRHASAQHRSRQNLGHVRISPSSVTSAVPGITGGRPRRTRAVTPGARACRTHQEEPPDVRLRTRTRRSRRVRDGDRRTGQGGRRPPLPRRRHRGPGRPRLLRQRLGPAGRRRLQPRPAARRAVPDPRPLRRHPRRRPVRARHARPGLGPANRSSTSTRSRPATTSPAPPSWRSPTSPSPRAARACRWCRSARSTRRSPSSNAS